MEIVCTVGAQKLKNWEKLNWMDLSFQRLPVLLHAYEGEHMLNMIFTGEES
jgi:hypothetical protein